MVTKKAMVASIAKKKTFPFFICLSPFHQSASRMQENGNMIIRWIHPDVQQMAFNIRTLIIDLLMIC